MPIAATFWPNRVIVQVTGFKSNEYTNLLAYRDYEPHKKNLVLDFRMARCYVSEAFKVYFALEHEGIKRVFNVMRLTSVDAMIPFVQSVKQAEAVIEPLTQ